MKPQYAIGDVFITSISEYYDNNWGIAEGIRELIANAYDNTDSSTDVKIRKEGNNFIIEDNGHGVTVDEMTILGSSTGKGASTFGEGLKIGANVITKYGGSLLIETYDKDEDRGVVYKVYLAKQRESSQLRVLHWEEVGETNRKSGTKITISGITDEDILKAKNYMTYFRDWKKYEEQDEPVTEYFRNGYIKFNVQIGNDENEDFIAINNQITSSDKAMKGEQDKSVLCYNLISQKNAGEIDKEFRKELWTKSKGNLNLEQIKTVLERAVINTNSKEVTEKIIDAFSRNMQRIETTRFYYGEIIKNPKLWIKSLHQKMGEKICIASGDNQLDGLAQDKGYKTVDWGRGNSLLKQLKILTAQDVVGKRITNIGTKSFSQLLPDEKQNVYKATKILLEVYQKHIPYENIKNNKMLLGKIEFADSFQGEDSTHGVYTPSTDTITIARDSLKSLRNTLMVLNEELIHRWFRLQDKTRGFQNSLGDQAGNTYKWKTPNISNNSYNLSTLATKSDLFRKLIKMRVDEEDILRLRLTVQRRNPNFQFKQGTKATKSSILPQLFPYLEQNDLKELAVKNNVSVLNDKDITEY